MKRLFYLLNIVFILPLFSACQIGGMEPSVTTLVLPYEARTASCTSYSYIAKDGTETSFGPARGGEILVGFKPDVTLEAQQRLLDQFPFFDRLDGEVMMDSGEITKVLLLPEATCFEAEKTLKALRKLEEVNFATPVFNPTPSQVGTYEWVGLSNEFLVSLEEGNLEELNQLVAQTNTSIVFSLTDEIHVLSADKNSTGDALELSNSFNQLPFVTSAEPNYIYYLTPTGVEETGKQTIQSKAAKMKN